MEREFKVYWDDLNYFEVVIKNNTQIFDEKFYIEISNELLPLDIIGQEIIHNNKIIKLNCFHDIKIAQELRVYDQYNNYSILKHRLILSTSWFNDNHYYGGNDLGHQYTKEKTTFTIWAPTALIVNVIIYQDDIQYLINLSKKENGVFQGYIEEDIANYAYYFVIKRDGVWVEANDPYARASHVNEGHSIVVDPELVAINLNYRDEFFNYQHCEAIIYELSIRDFTSDSRFEFKHPKKFLGMIESDLKYNNTSIGYDYIKNLGVTHIQLMPFFDFGSVDELDRLPLYNWGYDPRQYNVIENSYSIEPNNPLQAIIDLKKLIRQFHNDGLRVNMDVVYNHVYKTKTFSYNKILPYYFFRVEDSLNLSNGSGCGNDVASENRMVSKFIIDSLVYFTREFHIDGFRFDLMGLLDVKTMNDVASALKQIKPNIMLYGEGWKMNSAYPIELLAHSENAFNMPDIGFFNANFRDDLKGSTFSIHERGIVNGDVARGYNLKYLLLGCSTHKSGNQLFLKPSQSINYVSCHDNHTLYDKLLFTSLNQGINTLKSQHHLALAFVLLAQGVSLIYGGSEFYATKQGIENSYNLDDSINKFDWQRMLDNQDAIEYIKGLIAIKKEIKAFSLNDVDLIEQHICVDVRGNIIEYSLKDIEAYSNYHNVKVIFNIGNEDNEYYFKDYYDCLVYDNQASTTPLFRSNKLILKPYTTTIMAH